MFKKFVTFLFTAALLFGFLAACGNEEDIGTDPDDGSTSSAGDSTAPVPGNSGAITVDSVDSSSVTISWAKASDDTSAEADLQYKVYYSTESNISTPADAANNGTASGDFSTDIASASISGLTENTRYYLAVLVKDEAGNEAVYSGSATTWQTDTDWTKRITLDIAAQGESLSGFQTLVVLNDSRVSYSNFAADGTDIRFAQGENTLPYEIESWNESGDSYIWVRVPEIAASASTPVFMYYGNSSATTNVEDAAAVWDGYEMVFHMNDTTITNSSPNSINTTPHAPKVQTGIIGNAYRTEDSNKRYIEVDYVPSMTNWTIEAWVKADNDPAIISEGHSNGPLMGHTQFNLGWDHSDTDYVGAIQYKIGNWGSTKLGSLSGGSWIYLAGIFDFNSGTVQAFNNGTLVNTTTGFVDTPAETTTKTFIGVAENVNTVMDGLVDEVRVTTNVRSATWISAQYKSMQDDLISYGSVEDN